MISFYLKKIKEEIPRTFFSTFHEIPALILFQDLFFIILSIQISLVLRLGEEIFQIPPAVNVLNTLLYVLFGLSVFLGKHIYKGSTLFPSWGGLSSISLSVTYITLLYLPIAYILPPELTLPRSTPFINCWFVLIVLLEIPRLFYGYLQGKSIEIENKKLTSFSKPQPLAFEDLLKRPPLSFDLKNIKAMIMGKRILVTGVGGTLGRELVRKISEFNPSHIALLDNSEYLMYVVDRELNESHPGLLRESFLGDVASRERVRHIISTFKPELVFHAAALKHIPLGEENISQAVLTNVLGTRNVADACRDFNVKAMLSLSTNEANAPTNVIGATKRLSESYCQSLDILERKKPNGTRYASVRFGNVIGSSGSVVPLFLRQVEKGGPLTMTHPDMMRYFITIHEAVGLILQTMALTANTKAQAGRVFVLNMGEPIKILDLARQIIILSGLKPDEDIEIKFTGLRPGEKLVEELSLEQLAPTQNLNIFTGTFRIMDHGFLSRALQELETITKSQDCDSILRLLHALVPDYKTIEFNEDVPTEQEP